MRSSVVAVIDIGSNSIKSLVAAKLPTGQLASVKARTLDARISTGISKAKPELSAEGMTRGLGAIRELLDEVSGYRPAQTLLVATSAVRDASNGAEFRKRVKTATGRDIRVLTGDEEANLIGRGLTCDPALAELQDFQVFDLGGGSLELLSFKKRKITQALSLQLGCVRTTEKFVKNTAVALPQAEADALVAHVREEITKSGFKFLPASARSVFTGGSMSTVRAIKGATQQLRLEDTPPEILASELQVLIEVLSPLELAKRKAIPGMPSSRADVFPAALLTMRTLAECGGIEQFTHSLYNLRWGLAAEALGA